MFHDPIAAKRFAELVEKYQFKAIVETGTYHAESALIFSYYAPQVFTMELNPEFYRISLSEIESKGYAAVAHTSMNVLFSKNGRTILAALMDSAKWLEKYLDAVPEPTCFYLDAHWESYWPILDELKALKGRKNCVIIIHDFKVPDKDFGYDTYNGHALDFNFVKEDLMAIDDFRIEYNEEAAGNYRGILYALPK